MHRCTFFLHDSFPCQCVLKELADVLGTAWTWIFELFAHGDLSFNISASSMALEAFCHHALSLHSMRLVAGPLGRGEKSKVANFSHKSLKCRLVRSGKNVGTTLCTP